MARATSDEPLGTERITARVTRVRLPDGRMAAVKRAAPNAPVGREAAVLRFLRKRGCAVPEVISASDEGLVTEWCGDMTLDDALQTGLRIAPQALGDAVSRIGRALSGIVPIPPIAREALAGQLAPWVEALPRALDWLAGCAREAQLRAVVGRATDCEPQAGSLDYTARNVLVDHSGERVWLIDFAAIGFDWTERRLAQYALSAGAGRAGGVFRSALEPASGTALEDAGGVDAHEVILLLTAAEHLRQVEAGQAHPQRARAWSNVAERKASLIELMRRPFAESGPAAELRAALR